MREIGKVTGVEKDYLIVSVDKKDECSKCGMCAFPKNATNMLVRAKNTTDGGLGDLVIIERQAEAKLTGIFLVFLVPLFLIAIALLVNYLFIKNDLALLGMSVGLVALWYVILSKIDKKLSKLNQFCWTTIAVEQYANDKKEKIN